MDEKGEDHMIGKRRKNKPWQEKEKEWLKRNQVIRILKKERESWRERKVSASLKIISTFTKRNAQRRKKKL